MYRVDLNENRLSRLVQKKFSDLKISERGHLQEWLANQPDALGEELLIIQKEFDGFAETRERLDLLALDKDGIWSSSRTSSTTPAATLPGKR